MSTPKSTTGGPRKGPSPHFIPKFISFQVAISHDYEASLFALDTTGRIWIKMRAFDPDCPWSLADRQEV